MSKIIIDDEILNQVCENLSHTLQAELLSITQAELANAVMVALERRQDEAIPKPEFLKKMIVKKTDDNGNKKRS